MDRNFSTVCFFNSCSYGVAPRRGAWIEIQEASLYDNNCFSRTPQGCVDRNLNLIMSLVLLLGRTPQGCVDRNLIKLKGLILIIVAPRRGAWIEISAALNEQNRELCRTPQGCVDRNL